MGNTAIIQPQRRLRAGIVGGGRGAFIGSVHRMAAELDGQARVVAGALSSDPRIARESAAAWLLERAYASYMEMASSEGARRDDGIDFVIIATPNDLHRSEERRVGNESKFSGWWYRTNKKKRDSDV